jgi:protein-tyrosine phosphatase
VPDPYFGGEDGFPLVLDLVEAACRGLLEHVRAELVPVR